MRSCWITVQQWISSDVSSRTTHLFLYFVDDHIVGDQRYLRLVRCTRSTKLSKWRNIHILGAVCQPSILSASGLGRCPSCHFHHIVHHTVESMGSICRCKLNCSFFVVVSFAASSLESCVTQCDLLRGSCLVLYFFTCSQRMWNGRCSKACFEQQLILWRLNCWSYCDVLIYCS